MKKQNRFVALCAGSLLVISGFAKAEEPGGTESRGRSSLVFTEEGKVIRVFRLNPDADTGRSTVDGTTPGNRVDPGDWRDDDGEGSELNDQAGIFLAAAGGNLSYHGGPCLIQAKEMSLFWGNWSGSDVPQHLSDFFSQFGTSGEYQTITQYYQTSSSNKIQLSNLGGFNRFDTTAPPSTVTDAIAQQRIAANFANGNLGTPDTNTVYFLYLPNGVKSTISGASSCTTYCGYHSDFTYGGKSIKYAVMPFPSCTGCQGNAQAGLSIYAASLTIVSGHEMREAATDALGTAWYDRSGNEADDKCAWKLFVANGFQYQKEWSNQSRGCVQTGF